MSHGFKDRFVVKLYSGGSSFSISSASFALSMRGLQPPQYFMPITICINYLITCMFPDFGFRPSSAGSIILIDSDILYRQLKTLSV
jgi:hypothetical protein